MKSKYWSLEQTPSSIFRDKILIQTFLDTLHELNNPEYPEEKFTDVFWHKLLVDTARALEIIIKQKG